jgi:hypothetical protein
MRRFVLPGRITFENRHGTESRTTKTKMQLKDIGYAVAALKAGKRVARAGWNGKGMFLFLLPAGDGIPTKVIHDPALRAVIESEVGGETFDALGSVRMFTADKKVLTGWLASQSDLLAEDWEIID